MALGRRRMHGAVRYASFESGAKASSPVKTTTPQHAAPQRLTDGLAERAERVACGPTPDHSATDACAKVVHHKLGQHRVALHLLCENLGTSEALNSTAFFLFQIFAGTHEE